MTTRRRLAEAPRVAAVALTNQTRTEPGNSWYRIVNQAGADPVVDIYGEIGWDVWGDEFAADFRAIDAPRITVKISSPGGSVFEGLVIYNAILDHPATVNVIVDGMAASAASFIAQAGDHVLMNRGAQLMIHDASGLCMGNASDMEDMRDLLNKVSGEIAGVYAARAGGTVDEWRDLMRAETWMTGPEAVECGLADAAAATARRGATTEESTESPAARLASGFRAPARPEPATGGPVDPAAAHIVGECGHEHAVPVAAAEAPPCRTVVYSADGATSVTFTGASPPGLLPEPAPPITEQPATNEAPDDVGGFTFPAFIAALTGGGPQ